MFHVVALELWFDGWHWRTGGAVRVIVNIIAVLVLSSDGLIACPDRARLDELGRAAGGSSAAPEPQWQAGWDAYLQARRSCDDAAALLAALALQATQAVDRNQPDLALTIESERLAIAERKGLQFNAAEAAERVGTLLSDRGERDVAIRRLHEASAGYARLEDWGRAANVESRLSRVQRQAGDYFTALAHEQAALAMRRRLDPPPSMWRSQLNIAVLYEQLEIFDEARRRYAEALVQAEAEGEPRSIAVVLGAFAGYLSDFGKSDAPQALKMAERALEISTRQGGVVQRASARLQVGRAQLNLGQLDAADRTLTAAYADARAGQHEALMAHILFRRGELAHAQGQLDLALQRITDAKTVYETQGNRHRLAKVHAALEKLYRDRGESLLAAEAGLNHYRLRDELLGNQAIGRMREALNRFELHEERARNAELAQEKAMAEINLLAEQRRLQLIYLVAAGVLIALILLAWRYATARRLYRMLSEQNRLVLEQAAQLSLANEQLREQSEKLMVVSVTDGLTGLKNRSQAMERLSARLAAGEDFAVLLIDIDHFKQINDRFGHPVGDAVLQQLASRFREGLPDVAETFRVGGEEFMVLLPAAQARQQAERLRKAINATPFRIHGGAVDIAVCVGGITVSDLPVRSPEAAYAAADRALYRAKQDGRNCLRWTGTEAAILH